MEEIVQNLIKQALKKRDSQILERLAQLGHTFSNEIEKQEFAKTRLTMHRYEDKPQWRELYLDKTHLIASWWETISWEKGQAYFGKHPDECNFNLQHTK